MSVNDCEKHDWNGKAQKLVPKCPWCRIALLEAENQRLRGLFEEVGGVCYSIEKTRAIIKAALLQEQP